MNSFASAFTAALIDFVWQGTVIGVAAAIGMRRLRRRSAQARYLLGAVALSALTAAPIVTTASRYWPGASTGTGTATTGPMAFSVRGNDARVGAVDPRPGAPSAVVSLQPLVLPIWSVGVLLLSLRLIAGGLEVQALRRSGQPADTQMSERIAQLASRMGIRRAVRVITSTRAESPGVIGWLRPIVLLPPATLMGLTTSQLDAVLAHELAHIRRHDYLVNIAQMVAETLLFYHPAVWWVSRRLRIERELCCDDEAVRVCGDAPAYARALVSMARRHVAEMAMASTGGSLSDRVRRLLGISDGDEQRSAALVTIAVAVVLMSLTLATVNAQKEPARFEVASVRPADPSVTRGGALEMLPGGIVRGTRVPLRFMVSMAYDVPFRFVDGESELLDERYAIDARAPTSALPPEGATFQQMFLALRPVLREMMKNLLAERFKLVLHVEKQEHPIYALVVSGNGPKLKAAERDCAPKTMADVAIGGGPCGMQGGGPAGGLRLRNAEVANLAEALNSLLDRPVVNRTGISGRYDIDLPPWSTGRPPRDQSGDPNPEPQPDPDGPSIFTVLQSLGLRLEETRGPLDIYIVDHVERPAPN